VSLEPSKSLTWQEHFVTRPGNILVKLPENAETTRDIN